MEKYIFSALIGSLVALIVFGSGLDSPFFFGLTAIFLCYGVVVGLNKLFG